MKSQYFMKQLMAIVMIIMMIPTKAWSADLTPLTAGQCAALGLDASYVGYYAISSAESLAWFRDFVNTPVTGEGSSITYPNASSNAVLTQDIDMSPVSHPEDYEHGIVSQNWTPIGHGGACFTGKFDGNHKTISNLYIYTSEYESEYGLFGVVGNLSSIGTGTVKDLTVTSSTIGCSFSKYVSAIAGKFYGNSISGCTVDASVTIRGHEYVGGIAGYALGSSEHRLNVSNCSNSATVNAIYNDSHVAGVVGTGEYINFSNCTNAGDVKGAKNVGGIISCLLNGDIVGCSNTAKISNVLVSEVLNAGGIVSYMRAAGEAHHITSCHNTGEITSVGSNVGGIVGYVDITSGAGDDENGEVLITKCYNSGRISSSYSDEKNMGGIVGNADLFVKENTTTITLTDCYNTGAIVSTNGGSNIGGIVGNCYKLVFHRIFNYSTITADDSSDFVGALVGWMGGSFGGPNSISNCYFNSSICPYAYFGIDFSGVTPNDFDRTTEEFASGEIAWGLNEERAAGTAEKPLVWYQKLGENGDSFPIFTAAEGNTVLYGYKDCIASEKTYSNDIRYDERDDCHNYTSESDGICTACGYYQPAAMVTEDNAADLGLDASYAGYYAISNAGNLGWFRNTVNKAVTSGGTTTYPNQAVNGVLTADINMSELCHPADDANGTEELSWEPIGTGSTSKYLGNFDGNNHKVTDLYINSNADYSGFIGYLGESKTSGDVSCSVKNLTVYGAVKSSKKYTGGIVGYSMGNISDCLNYASIETNEGASYVGGIAGACETPVSNLNANVFVKVDRCENHGEIKNLMASTYGSIGGITGSTKNAIISNCSNTGSIDVKSVNVGGIVGKMSTYTLKMSGCNNSGDIISEGSYVGGLIGYVFGSPFSAVEIDRCYNTGSVTANGQYVGGISGWANTTQASSITNCYNTGNVKSTTKELNGYVGGAFGNVRCQTIQNIYSSGTLYTLPAAKENVGGFAGHLLSDCENCYFDNEKAPYSFYGGKDFEGDLSSTNAGKTTKEFESGEVAWLLNGSKDEPMSSLAWFQYIGVDKSPTLERNDYTVVHYYHIDGYYNYTEILYSYTINDGTPYEAKMKRFASDFTYTRTFGSAGKWNTWYVPFDLTLTDKICQKYAFSRINNVHQYDEDDNGVADVTVVESFRQTSGTTLKANHPYLVKALTDADKTMKITLNDVDLAPADENGFSCMSMDYIYTFTGTYKAMDAGGDDKYAMSTDGTWTHFDSLRPQRHYLSITSRNASNTPVAFNAKKIILKVIGDESATGVVHLYNADKAASETYDLSGRRVKAGSQTRGMYIKNGKVVVVK